MARSNSISRKLIAPFNRPMQLFFPEEDARGRFLRTLVLEHQPRWLLAPVSRCAKDGRLAIFSPSQQNMQRDGGGLSVRYRFERQVTRRVHHYVPWELTALRRLQILCDCV